MRVGQAAVLRASRIDVEDALAEVGEERDEAAVVRPLPDLCVVHEELLVGAVGVDGVDLLVTSDEVVAVCDDLAVEPTRSCDAGVAVAAAMPTVARRPINKVMSRRISLPSL